MQPVSNSQASSGPAALPTAARASVEEPSEPKDTLCRTNPYRDAPAAHGELYEIRPSEPLRVLRQRDETRPNGADVPDDAVSNRRVVLGVEGVDGKPASYDRMLSSTLLGTSSAVDLQQPILMVHEGIETCAGVSLARIMRDDCELKELEHGDRLAPETIFAHDPAVKTTRDVLQQSLDRGLDVLLLAHSGGGTESALALSLLSSEDSKYRGEIRDHVKVLSLAGASTPIDYEAAGVPADHVLYVGDSRDPVARTVSRGDDPKQSPVEGRRELLDAVRSFASDSDGFHAHQPDNIVRQNQAEVAAFLVGGPGGVHLATPHA
jgi:hypothetical protein